MTVLQGVLLAALTDVDGAGDARHEVTRDGEPLRRRVAASVRLRFLQHAPAETRALVRGRALKVIKRYHEMYTSEMTYASVAYHSFQIRLLRASEAHSYSHVILAINLKHLLKQPDLEISHKHKLHITDGGEVPCFFETINQFIQLRTCP